MDIKQRYFEKIISKLQRVTKNLDFLNELNLTQFQQTGGVNDVDVTELSNALVTAKDRLANKKAVILEFARQAEAQIGELRANIDAIQNRVNRYAEFVNTLDVDFGEENVELSNALAQNIDLGDQDINIGVIPVENEDPVLNQNQPQVQPQDDEGGDN